MCGRDEVRRDAHVQGDEQRRRTPKLAAKMPLHSCTAHPTWVELFQTTCVKWDACGSLGLYSAVQCGQSSARGFAPARCYSQTSSVHDLTAAAIS